MNDSRGEDDQSFAQLHCLAHITFPKQCNNCGLDYHTADFFLLATHCIGPDVTGLKQGCSADGSPIIELFRNCTCGSNLMAEFKCRRDHSASGIKRRGFFGEVLSPL